MGNVLLIKNIDALWKLLRDILLFVGGMTGIGFETVSAKPVNQSLLIVFAAMCGLPAFLRGDEKLPGKNKNEENK